MKYYKFVSWDIPEIEKILTTIVPLAIQAADNGDKKLLKSLYGNSLSIEHLQSGVYKIHGWAFDIKDYCKCYWVKTRYNEIVQYYAPNKECIYKVIGRYNVLEIIDVTNLK